MFLVDPAKLIANLHEIPAESALISNDLLLFFAAILLEFARISVQKCHGIQPVEPRAIEFTEFQSVQ